MSIGQRHHQRLTQGPPCLQAWRHGALRVQHAGDELNDYPVAFEGSWLHDELYRARNFKPWMAKGLVIGTLGFGVDQVLLRGKAPYMAPEQCTGGRIDRRCGRCRGVRGHVVRERRGRWRLRGGSHRARTFRCRRAKNG